jgi:hypothetical protein
LELNIGRCDQQSQAGWRNLAGIVAVSNPQLAEVRINGILSNCSVGA